MKKNFIKKTLASTLAFAMVATVVPVAPASAAKAPALNKTGKVLYLNENEVGSTFNFNVVNQVKGSTYKWASADKTIATVNAKTGVVTAKKVGTVKVTCKITLPTKKTKTLTATVAVKENAVKAAISNPVENIGVNEEYNFNKSFTTASGGKCTDYQNWVLDTTEGANTAGATVDAKSGKVTATKTGSFKIKVQAYQNATKLAAGDVVESEWLTVNVKLAATEVKQTADNKIVFTYNDTLTDKTVPKTTDITVKNTTTNQVMAVKSVSYKDKVVTAELYSSLTDAAVYDVTVGDFKKQVTASVGAVATATLNTATVEYNKLSDLSYSLFDANGVDVTNAKATTTNVQVDFESTGGYLDTSTAGKPKVFLYAIGNTAKVTVTYHTYKYDDKGVETGKATVTGTITATDKAALGNYAKYTFAASTPNFSKDTLNTQVAIGDNMKIYVQAFNASNTEVNTTVGNAASVVAKYGSSDDSIILVNSDGSVTGVKEGTAYVIAYDSNSKEMWTFPVTVVAARKSSSLTLATPGLSLSNTPNVVDTKKTKVTLKDQFGSDMSKALTFLNSNGNVSAATPIEHPSTYAVAPTVTLPAKSGGDITVTAQGATPGTYKYLIAASDNTNVRTVLTVDVKAVPTANVTTSYQLVVSSNKVDTTVTKDSDVTTDYSVTVQLGEFKNNVLNQYIALPTVTAKLTTDSTKTVTPTTTIDTATLTFAKASGTATVVSKAAVGTYIVSTTYNNVTYTSYVTVSDSQSLPSLAVNKKTSSQSTILDAVKDCITVNGTDAYDSRIQSVDFSSANSTITTDTQVLPAGTSQVHIKGINVLVEVKDNDGTTKREVVIYVPVTTTLSITN